MIVSWFLNVQLQIYQANSCEKKTSSTIYIVIHKNEGGVRQPRATTHGSLWISMGCLLRCENKAFVAATMCLLEIYKRCLENARNVALSKHSLHLWSAIRLSVLLLQSSAQRYTPLWLAEQIRRLSPVNRHQYTEEIKIG